MRTRSEKCWDIPERRQRSGGSGGGHPIFTSRLCEVVEKDNVLRR